MEGTRIVGKRPPHGTLIGFVIYAAIALGAFAILKGFYDDREKLFSPTTGSIIYGRYGFVIVVAICGLLLVAACVRIVQRWTSSAQIRIEGGDVVLRLPKHRPWWLLVQPGVVETRIPVASIRALRILPLNPAVLEIEADQTICVPSKVFATGVYSIDAALREEIGSGAWPHPTAKVGDFATWQTSHLVRIMMPVGGLALIAVAVVISAALGPTGGGKVAFLPFIFGLGLLIAVGFYRGRVILDPRGMFYERGGTTTYLAWSELDRKSLEVKSNLGGAWKELRITTAKNSTIKQQVSLNRILGLGFPLVEISHEVAGAARTYR